MSLYLDEIYLKTGAPPEKIKQMLARMRDLTKSGLPKGVTLKAGPWFSNEELKIILVLDMQDHSWTVGAFTGAVLDGVVEKRRLASLSSRKPVEKW